MMVRRRTFRQGTLFLAPCLFFVLYLNGCATLGDLNPATGRHEFIVIPTDSEVAMGKNIHSEIAQKYGAFEKSSRFDRIQRIGQRLAAVSDRKDYTYQFYLLKKNDINAFTTPGGNIYFFSGLLDKLTTDDQIAAVLAHEIGHCAARHTIKKFQAALGYNLIGSIILSQVAMGEGAKSTLNLAAGAAMQLVTSAYSRKDEYEADKLGIKYMYLAGYSLNGMIETLTILQKESRGVRPPLILSTHPYAQDRVTIAREEIKAAPAKYQRP